MARRGRRRSSRPMAFVNAPDAIFWNLRAARSRCRIDIRMRTLSGVENLRVEGVVKETRKAKAFGGLVAIMAIDAAQRAFGQVSKVDRIDLAIAVGVNREVAQREFQALVAGRGEVGPPARRGEQTVQMVQSMTMAMHLSAGIAMFVGMFIIYNTVSVSVAQRRRDFGILRAVGVTSRKLISTILAEALIVDCWRVFVGVGLGS